MSKIHNFVSGCLWHMTITTKDTERVAKNFYAYDETGIVGSASTNEYHTNPTTHKWEANQWIVPTINDISLRAVKAPDFSKKDGFIVKCSEPDWRTDRAQYDVYVHVDNLPGFVGVEWRKNDTNGVGGLSGSFVIGCCRFGTWRKNERFQTAIHEAQAAFGENDAMYKRTSIYSNSDSGDIDAAVKALERELAALRKLQKVAHEVDTLTVEQLLNQ